MKIVDDEAIVLRVYPFAEVDGVVVLLTRSHGLVRVLARGWKRPKRPLAGLISPMNTLRTTFLPAKAADGLAHLRSAQGLRCVDVRKLGLEGFHWLQYMAEVVSAMVLTGEAGGLVFRLLSALAPLAEEKPFRWDRLGYFQLWVLRLEGVLPDIARCRTCGAVWADHPGGLEGGDAAPSFWGRGCRPDEAGVSAGWEREDELPRPAETARFFQSCLRQHPDNVARPALSQRELATIHSLLERRISQVLERPLKSYACLREMQDLSEIFTDCVEKSPANGR